MMMKERTEMGRGLWMAGGRMGGSDDCMHGGEVKKGHGGLSLAMVAGLVGPLTDTNHYY